MTYKHDNCEVSTVRIEFDLPPEVTDQAISRALTSYGEVLDIRHEMWSNIYKVPNGIRTALTTLKKHIPSRMIIAGHRATRTTTDVFWVQLDGPPILALSQPQA